MTRPILDENSDLSNINVAFGNYSFYTKHTLTEAFIEKYQNELDWGFISCSQKLSEELLEKHSNKINWTFLSYHQKLSEKLIKKYKDEVYWPYISNYQKLSMAFISNNLDKLNVKLLKLNKNIDNNKLSILLEKIDLLK